MELGREEVFYQLGRVFVRLPVIAPGVLGADSEDVRVAVVGGVGGGGAGGGGGEEKPHIFPFFSF